MRLTLLPAMVDLSKPEQRRGLARLPEPWRLVLELLVLDYVAYT
ncbi:hypothetical protein [Hymenobacter sp. CRA2]|nr:hypothetical protein [Hymenobacter sp. CRA2]